MSGQTITIRGTSSDCWIVNRFISDDPNWFSQSFEEEWFDALAAHWVVAYDEAPTWPQVPYQFVLRCQPISC